MIGVTVRHTRPRVMDGVASVPPRQARKNKALFCSAGALEQIGDPGVTHLGRDLEGRFVVLTPRRDICAMRQEQLNHVAITLGGRVNQRRLPIGRADVGADPLIQKGAHGRQAPLADRVAGNARLRLRGNRHPLSRTCR